MDGSVYGQVFELQPHICNKANKQVRSSGYIALFTTALQSVIQEEGEKTAHKTDKEERNRTSLWVYRPPLPC